MHKVALHVPGDLVNSSHCTLKSQPFFKRPSPRRRCLTECNVRARWCIDIRYGFKQEASALMQEWVRDVGSKAGLVIERCSVSSGAIGVPESRLELEVLFGTLAEWEGFLSRIPAREHRAWSQRIQSMIVHGSPKWEIYRSIPIAEPILLPQSQRDAANESASSKDSMIIKAPDSSPADQETSGEVVLDWKGEPMHIRPGDKLPFKFL